MSILQSVIVEYQLSKKPGFFSWINLCKLLVDSLIVINTSVTVGDSADAKPVPWKTLPVVKDSESGVIFSDTQYVEGEETPPEFTDALLRV